MGDLGWDRHLRILPRYRGHKLLGGIECISFGVGREAKLIKTIAVAHTGRENQAVGIAILYLFRSLGSVIGISLSAAIIQHVLREQVREAFRNHLDVESILRHVRMSLEYIDTLDPQTQAITRFRWSFFLDLFMFDGAIGLGILICEKPLHKQRELFG
jgi:hypothetical protein